MENIVNMPRPEILMVADTVAREKNIDRENDAVYLLLLDINDMMFNKNDIQGGRRFLRQSYLCR